MSEVAKKPTPARVFRARSSSGAETGPGDTQRRGKGGGSTLPPRAKSTLSKPSKPRTRTLRNTQNGHLIQKTQSDTALVSNGRNVNGNVNGSSRVNSIARVPSAGVVRPCKSMEDVAQQILSSQAKNIVVMAGAGISTGSGIPDFRSPGTGLYDNLRQYRIPYPQAIFELDYFEGNPRPFFTLAKELYPGKFRPNLAHFFLRLLHEKGVLLRVYTQNIDGLERTAGIPASKLVEAHGTFMTASCIKCNEAHPPDEVKQLVYADKIPRCRKKGCLGLIKPDIVFFGEDLPRRFYYYLKDFPQADLLIVMGTSLEVEPFASIVDSVRRYVPRILFNRVPVGPFSPKRRMNDVTATGDLARNVSEFVKILGWESDLQGIIDQSEKSFKDSESSPRTPPGTILPPSSGYPALDQAFTKLNIGVNQSSHNNNTKHSPIQRPALPNTRRLHNSANRYQARLEMDLMKKQVQLVAERRGSTSSTKSDQTANRLPKMPHTSNHSHTSFHAQRHLYRTKTEEEDSSSEHSQESSDDSTSSDDD